MLSYVSSQSACVFTVGKYVVGEFFKESKWLATSYLDSFSRCIHQYSGSDTMKHLGRHYYRWLRSHSVCCHTGTIELKKKNFQGAIIEHIHSYFISTSFYSKGKQLNERFYASFIDYHTEKR